ncbi:1,2-phenylacetyl-CoA epoxidase subunit PaaD [Undibacterium sp. TS12]|uniref:1,2-phenylacetyl-CoA epoxidase subunit PaaD n=1 Tax=Undibacterium sp. TS12 TaxID=2908202 RepID=UPI001F4CDDD7|nr:1,2-phenylacetyl-CoA epoxidase subunit PaaD [Undibacterium sp. TS12]MCH8619102.1 phenylacetate-CoA oxygenase subunit PaaJ [Undibacterium sp. TS12]
MVSLSDEIAATPEQIWQWLGEVNDPEIPVISVTDLGIVRKVELLTPKQGKQAQCAITITPTYSGCPAMDVIEQEIRAQLRTHGLHAVHVIYQLSPAWSTDWMTAEGKRKLRDYGIAPPQQQVIDISAILRPRQDDIAIVCPQCGSDQTQLVSQFGSTSCKALYKCRSCLEPFDYFKPH